MGRELGARDRPVTMVKLDISSVICGAREVSRISKSEEPDIFVLWIEVRFHGLLIQESEQMKNVRGNRLCTFEGL